MPSHRSLRRSFLLALAAGSLAAPLLPSLAAAEGPTGSARPGGAVGAPPVGALTRTASDLGFDRLGVRRGDSWVLSESLDGRDSRRYQERTAGWLPVVGDTDGDGNESVSLFRDGVWQLRDSEGGRVRTVRFGQRGDRPVLGDWNGDGVATVGLLRGGRWYLREVNGYAPSRTFGFGIPGDVPVVGDWDANGRTDIAVRRGATWYQRDSSSSGPTSRTFAFGTAADLPVSGDWDHDGRDTPGVFRNGTWYLRRGTVSGPVQTVRFGRAGDLPVVRRTQGLAPGVTHQVLADPTAPWVAHVATVDLAASSSPEAVLSGDRLAGTERLSRMTNRAAAVLGINGDFFLPSGRPVHVFASDGRLAQTAVTLGRAFSLDAGGTGFAMGYPDVQSTVTTQNATGTVTLEVPLTNVGPPVGDTLAAFNSFGGSLETPPADYCYTGLAGAGTRTVRPDGRIDTPLTVTGARCGGPAPAVLADGTVLTADPFMPSGAVLRGLSIGQAVTMSTQLGFPGAVDVLGGNPLLVVNGAVMASEVDGTSAFFGRAPRTAVGWTASGRLLLVVVDGRATGYSRGMSMRELAELMVRLGAYSALNLDGGGSSEMVLNGVVASRPSDGAERGIANALVVLPGTDRGQADLTGGGVTALQRAGGVRDSLSSSAVSDPASVGGLADELLRQGVPMAAELRRTGEAYQRSR